MTQQTSYRPAEKGVPLEFVEVGTDLPSGAPQLKPEAQLLNFSLARAVSNSFLQQRVPQDNAVLSSHDIIQGVKAFSWPGRFQSISDGNPTRYLLPSLRPPLIRVTFDAYEQAFRRMASYLGLLGVEIRLSV